MFSLTDKCCQLSNHPSGSNDSKVWQAETLYVSSARVRHGALLGLASLDDPQAIPSIEKAIEREQAHDLLKIMRKVIRQLKETLNATTAAQDQTQ